MKKFCVLSKPYAAAGAQNTVVYRVQALEYPRALLHNDRTLQNCVVRVTTAGRTYAGFESEDHAYLAINDYYVMHGELTPYVRVAGSWLEGCILTTGQTTEQDTTSEPMEFE